MGRIEKLLELLAIVVIICGTTTIHVVTPDEVAAFAAEPARVDASPDARPGRITGRVTIADGRPVNRFAVRVVPAPRTEAGTWEFPVRAPEPVPKEISSSVEVVSVYGEFVLEALAPGRYRVGVEAKGFEPATSDVVVVAPGGEPAPVAIRLDPTRPGR
jgi:hypothetical protein